MRNDPLTGSIIGACIEVHRLLGPGLLESSYSTCLAYEMAVRGISFRKEVPMPLVYKEVRLDAGYRIDFVVEEQVIVEVKALPVLAPVHDAQILTYLKLSGLHTGLLVNFNVKELREGLKRLVLNRPEEAEIANTGIKG